MEGVLEIVQRGVAEIAALQPDAVHPHHAGVVARHQREGRRVLRKFGVGGTHHALADARVLVDAGVGAEHREVFDRDVTREPAEARDHHVRADLAVVRDVRAVHHHHVVAETRDPATLRRAAVDRHALANLVVGADLEAGGLAGVLLVLRRRPPLRTGGAGCAGRPT
jgi:hypothetical protein